MYVHTYVYTYYLLQGEKWILLNLHLLLKYMYSSLHLLLLGNQTESL